MYAARLKAMILVLGLGMLLVGVSLARIQVFEGTRYRDEAQSRLKRPPGFHPTIRGAIFDRNGIVLAHDVLAFDVAVYFPYIEMTDEFLDQKAREWRISREDAAARIGRMWAELARLANVPQDELARRAETIRARVDVIRATVADLHGRRIRVREENCPPAKSVAHPIVYDVDLKTVLAIRSRPEDFPGLAIENTRKRDYPQTAAPHVIGRLGEVTREELDGGPSRHGINKPYPPGNLRRYWPGDFVGRGGVETACESILRGARGLFQKGIEDNFLEDIPPTPGRDVHLTLDIALQADIEEILDRPIPGSAAPRHSGAAVVLDCRTGEVLTLATAPRYDPRTFQERYGRLEADPAAPLVNRAVAGRYPLGSVFKAVTASAGLHEGAITPATTFTCEGVLDPAHPNRFRCDVFVTHGAVHGPLPLRTAIQKSCNIYFYHVAEALCRDPSGRMDVALGARRLQTWADRFGFGRTTGIGLGGEDPGSIDVGDPRNLAIGQGQLSVTPLQVAQVYGLVATSGRMPPLRLIREVPREDTRPELQLNEHFMATLRDAFTAVVNEQGGTGYATVYLPEIRIAGKTGTAQAGSGEPHAWFAGFAPAENPRVAFAVIIEHGGHGGTIAGPVAREIVKACQAHGYIDGLPHPAPDAAGRTPNGKNTNGNGRNGNGAHLPAPPSKPAPVPVG